MTRRSLLLTLALGLVGAGCTPCKTSPAPQRNKAVYVEPESPDILLAALEPGDRATWTVGVIPVLVRESGVETAPRIELPFAPGGPPPVAASGPYLYLARGSVLERHQPFETGATPTHIDLPSPPTALLAVGSQCLVGSDHATLSRVDFATTPPAVHTLHKMPNVGKPIDFLIRPDSTRLLAVDDVILPKYLFSYELASTGSATFQFQADLPSGPNEAYTAVSGTGNRFAAIARFGHMGGSGWTLYRCSLDGEKLDSVRWSEHRPSVFDRRPVVVPGAPGTAVDAATPVPRSPWGGVALVGEDVLIGAYERGLLHMPWGATSPRLVATEEPALYVIVVKARLFVVEGPFDEEAASRQKRALVEVRWSGSLTEVRRGALPDGVVALRR